MTCLHALRRGDLVGARELRLASCGLTSVPPEVFGLADTLEVLDLSGNALTALPDDLGRLAKLRVLFTSGNRFERLPPVLGDCAALSQVGCRGSGVREVPAEALPPRLRWLTLTDNALERLPDSLGARPHLQKLMLAGNRLRELPKSLEAASRLELVRVSANALEALPAWLLDLPRLAWLAWAGNPGAGLETASRAKVAPGAEMASRMEVAWAALTCGALLGEGASGRVVAARWRMPDGAERAVAVKLYKAALTSDGLPACEMAACLAAGDHPNLVGGLAQVRDHPAGVQGLVMPLLPPHWRALAAPPSLESCSRDVYPPATRLPLAVGLRIAAEIGAAAAHLHARGILHGDLYAHNVLWNGGDGAAKLSDFGAASFMPASESRRLQRLDVLAWGLLLGELLERCDAASPGAARLCEACTGADPAARPSMADALEALAASDDRSAS